MKKEYKHTYGMNAICFFIQMYLMIFNMLIIDIIVSGIQRNEPIISNLLVATILVIVSVLVFAIICIIINLISKIFTKKKMYLSSDYLEYRNKKIYLKDISNINLFLGEMTKNSSTPVILSIIYNDGNDGFLSIERPSFLFLIRLRKMCKDRFVIEDLKKKLLTYSLLGLGLGVVLTLLVLFGIK